MSEGFTFKITPEESQQIGLGNYPAGHECMFMVKAELAKNDNGTLTFKATEIEKVGGNMDTTPAGSSDMYKAANKPPEPRVVYQKSAIQPHVS